MDIMLHVCDSALMKMQESACHCPIIVEKAFNPDNMEIAKMICGAIVMLTVIAALTILLWKLIGFWSEVDKAKRERANAIEDGKRKQMAEYQKKVLDLVADDKDKSLETLNNYIGELKK